MEKRKGGKRGIGQNRHEESEIAENQVKESEGKKRKSRPFNNGRMQHEAAGQTGLLPGKKRSVTTFNENKTKQRRDSSLDGVRDEAKRHSDQRKTKRCARGTKRRSELTKGKKSS